MSNSGSDGIELQVKDKLSTLQNNDASPFVTHTQEKSSNILNRQFGRKGNFISERVRRHALAPVNLVYNTSQSQFNTSRDMLTNKDLSNLNKPDQKKKNISEKKKVEGNILKILKNYSDHNVKLIILLIATIHSLLDSDLLNLLLDPKVAKYFDFLLVIDSVIFLIDQTILLLTIEGYLYCSFFLIDTLSFVSMIYELIIKFSQKIIEYDNKLDITTLEAMINSGKSYEIIQFIKIVRILRIVKVHNIYTLFQSKRDTKKLIKQKQIELKKEEKLEEITKQKEKKMLEKMRVSMRPLTSKKMSNKQIILKDKTGNVQEDAQKSHAELKRNELFMNSLHKFQKKNTPEINNINKRRINKVISESNTTKILWIIFIMAIVYPLFDLITNPNYQYTYTIVATLITNAYTIYGNNIIEINHKNVSNYVSKFEDPMFPIIKVTYENNTIYSDLNYTGKNYRTDEVGIINYNNLTRILYSKVSLSRIISIISIFKTLFCIGSLFILAIKLESDARKIVLKPLETLIKIVEEVAEDPVNIKNSEKLHIVKSNRRSSVGNKNLDDLQTAEYEIRIIQSSLVKISTLLAIGFGEAGGEILKENFGSQHELNAMLPGRKIKAIFGFCDIRNFSKINIALQEETMFYVNQIAEIVHSSVHKFNGAANKNIGEAFLLAWKLPSKKNSVYKDDKIINFYVDSSLLAFLNIIKKINKNPLILEYENRPEIKKAFENNFTTSMGFGLHVGWGIEGAIGSFYKVDCSYLSPNVNIAARLESATRQYGISILISEHFYNLLSEQLKKICKLIDRVKLKGCKDPIKIYTVHVNTNLKKSKKKKKNLLSKKEKIKITNLKKSTLFHTYSTVGSLGDLLHKKGFQKFLEDTRSPLFYSRFQEGYDNYISGNWKESYIRLREAHYLEPTDGPTKSLIKFISEKNCRPPYDWDGYRDLPK